MVAMSPGRAWPRRRLRYTWGDVVLTLASVLFTLYAIGKAEQAGSLVPFWVAYAAGLVAAAGWLAYDARRPRRCGPTVPLAGPAAPWPWPPRGW